MEPNGTQTTEKTSKMEKIVKHALFILLCALNNFILFCPGYFFNNKNFSHHFFNCHWFSRITYPYFDLCLKNRLLFLKQAKKFHG